MEQYVVIEVLGGDFCTIQTPNNQPLSRAEAATLCSMSNDHSPKNKHYYIAKLEEV